MVLDDVDELGEEHLEGRIVAGDVEVAVDRVEEPEGGVGRVVEALGLAVGEEVGDQAVADVVGERAEDVAGLVVPAGREGQPFEADHRVAAPVGEPVVAGDDGADLLARGVGASRVDSTRPAGVIRNWSAARTSSAAVPSAGRGFARLISRPRRVRSARRASSGLIASTTLPRLGRGDERDLLGRN